MDEDDLLDLRCGDLVSLARLEPGLLHLFRAKAAGEWVPVAELYRAAGQPAADLKDGLVAAWLPSPDGDPGGAVVLFTDTLWSMTTWYNTGRLRERHPEGAAAG
jgi:hypothetical protein